jgi:replication factor A1
MEKVYTFNVSFTDSTIALGNVCFQVNTVVAEIGDGGQVPISPSGSQPSSVSSARAASKSTSADSVPTGGISSQTPQSTKNYGKDKVTHAFEHSINLLLPPTRVALQTLCTSI